MRWPEWRAGQLDKVETALTYLEANIAVVTDRVDIGSLTIGCALWYLDLRFDDLDWRTRHPKVKAWYVKFSQRPSMQMAWSL
jgi:glutathione S-transferase